MTNSKRVLNHRMRDMVKAVTADLQEQGDARRMRLPLPDAADLFLEGVRGIEIWPAFDATERKVEFVTPLASVITRIIPATWAMRETLETLAREAGVTLQYWTDALGVVQVITRRDVAAEVQS